MTGENGNMAQFEEYEQRQRAGPSRVNGAFMNGPYGSRPARERAGWAQGLRQIYDQIVQEAVPADIEALLARL